MNTTQWSEPWDGDSQWILAPVSRRRLETTRPFDPIMPPMTDAWQTTRKAVSSGSTWITCRRCNRRFGFDAVVVVAVVVVPRRLFMAAKGGLFALLKSVFLFPTQVVTVKREQRTILISFVYVKVYKTIIIAIFSHFIYLIINIILLFN